MAEHQNVAVTRWTYLKIFCCFLIIYLLTTGGHIYSPDGEIMFRTTRALAEKGQLSIEPLLGFATKKGVGGKEFAQYGLGQPILAIPFYWAGKLLYIILPDSITQRTQLPTMQYHQEGDKGYVLRFAVSTFNQFIAALFAVVFFAFSYYLTKNRSAAILLTILYGLGTLAWPHSRPFFSESLAALCVFASLGLLYRACKQDMPGRAISLILLAGFLSGYAIFTRLDSLLTMPGFLIFIILANAGEKIAGIKEFLAHQIRHWRRYLFFLPPIGFMLVILILNWVRFGGPFTTGYSDQPEGVKFTTPLLAGLYGFLFSIGKGLFFFSPPLVLCLFSFGKFFKEYRPLAIATYTIIVVFLLAQSKWQNWTGGWCWGPRHIFLIHPFLALPIVALLKGLPWRIQHQANRRTSLLRVTVVVLIIIGFGVQIYGMSQSFIDFYVEFYRSPERSPNFHVLYSADDAQLLNAYYSLYLIDGQGKPLPRSVPLHFLIAPLNDSIYVPQNSQWYGYLHMLKSGRHDFFWLHFFSPPKSYN